MAHFSVQKDSYVTISSLEYPQEDTYVDDQETTLNDMSMMSIASIIVPTRLLLY